MLQHEKNTHITVVGLSCATAAGLASAQDLLTTYELAKNNDPVVLKAQAQFNAAQEGITQTRALLLPTIKGSATFSDATSESVASADNELGLPAGSIYDTGTETMRYSASLDMDIYRHSSWLRLDNAKKSAHQADVAYQSAKQNLIVRVTQAYFNVLSALDDLEFAKAERAAIERQLEQTKQRYSVGLTAVTAVHEAQAEYDNAETEVIRSENAVFNAEEALRTITNVYPQNLNILNTERFSASRPFPDSANEWQETAESKNLDLIVQKIAVDIAKENIGIAKAGHLPTLSLSGGLSRTGRDVTEPYNYNGPDLDEQSISLTLNVPIYEGGATSSGVREAQSNFVAASQDLARTHRDVVRNARNSYNTVIASVSGIKALEQSVISAESALKATEAGFDVGTRTIVDVLNSTRNLYNAKRNLSSTRYGYVQAILNLKLAGGTISEADIAQINQGLKEAE